MKSKWWRGRKKRHLKQQQNNRFWERSDGEWNWKIYERGENAGLAEKGTHRVVSWDESPTCEVNCDEPQGDSSPQVWMGGGRETGDRGSDNMAWRSEETGEEGRHSALASGCHDVAPVMNVSSVQDPRRTQERSVPPYKRPQAPTASQARSISATCWSMSLLL